MASVEKIREIVTAALEELFENVRIVSVYVRPDYDQDGDRVLLVDVVFDASQGNRLDSRKTSGLTRHVLPKMEQAGEEGFPVFSFIADSEMRKDKPETA